MDNDRDMPDYSPRQTSDVDGYTTTSVSTARSNEDCSDRRGSSPAQIGSADNSNGIDCNRTYIRDSGGAVTTSDAAVCRNEDCSDRRGSCPARIGSADRSGTSGNVGTIVSSAGKQEERCGICLEAKRSPSFTRCGHSFCEQCLAQHISCRGFAWAERCPLCRTPLNMGSGEAESNPLADGRRWSLMAYENEIRQLSNTFRMREERIALLLERIELMIVRIENIEARFSSVVDGGTDGDTDVEGTNREFEEEDN